jgi:hypothetical protein
MGLTEKIQMVSAEWGLISTVGVKAYPKVLEGSVLVTPMIRGEDIRKHPLGKLWTKYRKQPIEEMNPFYTLAAGVGHLLTTAAKIALKDVGYEKIGGDAMIKAFESLTGKDVTQGVLGACGYSPTSRVASRQIKLYRIKSGKVVPITDWITAPDCVSLGKW